MLSKSTQIISEPVTGSYSKAADYAMFIKFRLTFLVVFSAVIGFIIVSHKTNLPSLPIAIGIGEGFGGEVDWAKAAWLTLAGFLVTGAANGFNQIIERGYDKIMDRTSMRPLPQERMGMAEAILLASAIGIAGLLILWLFLNPLSCLLSALSIALYVCVYTPLKRITGFAVLAGAFPGAFPPLLGAIAATSNFGHVPFEGMVLFVVQFIWQFPHFWAIAWVMDEDYKKAGFRLLPSGERNKASAFQIVVYTLFLLPISLVPVIFKMTNTFAAPLVIVICGGVFFYLAIKLYKECSVNAAQKVMFASFAYLPIVQLAILLG